jgi:hypothetical protein
MKKFTTIFLYKFPIVYSKKFSTVFSKKFLTFNNNKMFQLTQVGFVDHQSVTEIITLAIENLFTPVGGAKHELLFNKPANSHLWIATI